MDRVNIPHQPASTPEDPSASSVDGKPKLPPSLKSAEPDPAQQNPAALLKKTQADLLKRGIQTGVPSSTATKPETEGFVDQAGGRTPETEGPERQQAVGRKQPRGEGSGEGRQGEKGSSESKPSPQPQSPETLGMAILQGMGQGVGQSSGSPGAESAAPSSPVMDIDKIEALISKVANRVLVTDPVSGQNAEVRVQLADDLIPGTEIRLFKGEGGRLHVEFDASSPQWAKLISDSVSALQDRLSAKIHLHEAPLITVKESSSEMPRDGRSRGGDSDQPPSEDGEEGNS